MSISAAHPLPRAGRRPAGAAERRAAEATPTLSRREATLRCGATVCLAGIALVQVLELPFQFPLGGQFVALSVVAMALCVGLGLALAAGSADTAPQLWRVVAVGSVLVLAGWAAPRAIDIPGLTGRTHWGAMPGGVSAALAAISLVLALAALRPTRSSLRGLATAVVVLVALAPGAGASLVAFGPGVLGGETSLASGVHVHNHGLNEDLIQYRSFGGHGGHYVYTAPAPPHDSPLGVALVVAATFVFLSGSVGYLRRRSDPALLQSGAA